MSHVNLKYSKKLLQEMQVGRRNSVEFSFHASTKNTEL
jgi:hypothetical protein